MLNFTDKADLAIQSKGIVRYDYDEQVLWTGRPKFNVFLLNSALRIFYYQLFFLGITAFCLLVFDNGKLDMRLLGGLFLMVLGFGSLEVFIEGRDIRKTTYVITNHSVIVCTGLTSSAIKTIPLRDIQTKMLKRTFIDKRYQTATISLFTGRMEDNDGTPEKAYDLLCALDDAETAYQYL